MKTETSKQSTKKERSRKAIKLLELLHNKIDWKNNLDPEDLLFIASTVSSDLYHSGGITSDESQNKHTKFLAELAKFAIDNGADVNVNANLNGINHLD